MLQRHGCRIPRPAFSEESLLLLFYILKLFTSKMQNIQSTVNTIVYSSTVVEEEFTFFTLSYREEISFVVDFVGPGEQNAFFSEHLLLFLKYNIQSWPLPHNLTRVRVLQRMKACRLFCHLSTDFVAYSWMRVYNFYTKSSWNALSVHPSVRDYHCRCFRTGPL